MLNRLCFGDLEIIVEVQSRFFFFFFFFFVKIVFQNALNAKFGSALTAEELDDKIDLRECLNMRHVLSSLQKMIQFTLSSATAEALVLDSKGSLVEVRKKKRMFVLLRFSQKKKTGFPQ